MTNKIALIIVHFGNYVVTQRCLKSINYFNDDLVQLIVVNNSKEQLSFQSRDILIVNVGQNRGYAAACNAGIQKAKELGINNFVLCNNDVQFTEEFFSHFLPRVKEVEYPVIVTPKINFLNNPNCIWYAGGKINKFKMEATHITHQQKEKLIETEFISGCCFYISQSTFKILGPMDDNYFLYDEDLDYSLRANAKGVKLMVDTTVTIFHDESSSTKNHSRIGKYKSVIYLHKFRSKILIMRKYSEFPYNIFNWCFIFYKYVKYTALYFIRGEYCYITKLTGILMK